MGLKNLGQQLGLLKIANQDVESLRAYANGMKALVNEINASWTSDADKRTILSAMNECIGEAVNLANNYATFSYNANRWLLEMDKLDKITKGLVVRSVIKIGIPDIWGARNSRFSIRPTDISSYADRINALGNNLSNAHSGAIRVFAGIDSLIVGRLPSQYKNAGIHAKITNLQQKNGRIAKSLKQISQVYQKADNNIRSYISQVDDGKMVSVRSIGAVISVDMFNKVIFGPAKTCPGMVPREIDLGKIAKVVAKSAGSYKLVDIVSDYYLFNKKHIKSIPKSIRKLAKNLSKYYLKNAGMKNLGKVYDVKDIVDDFIDKKYFDVAEDILNLVDVKGWNFEGVELTSDIGSYLSGGMDVSVLKLQAVIKTFKLGMDKNGYLQKNNDRYMQEATDRFLKGDIVGSIMTMPADFIQTVGKGTIDVSCQLVSSSLDSICKSFTGGLMDVSTFNSMCEDSLGFSMGTMFNDVSSAVNKGVDFYTDKILIDGYSWAGKELGKAFNTGMKGVKSGLKYLGNLF